MLILASVEQSFLFQRKESDLDLCLLLSLHSVLFSNIFYVSEKSLAMYRGKACLPMTLPWSPGLFQASSF